MTVLLTLEQKVIQASYLQGLMMGLSDSGRKSQAGVGGKWMLVAKSAVWRGILILICALLQLLCESLIKSPCSPPSLPKYLMKFMVLFPTLTVIKFDWCLGQLCGH